jgi:hypothetical protein
MTKKISRFAFLTILATVLVSGCATTKQARDVEVSGFLPDYSMLRPGEPGEPLLIYKNPRADWRFYKKLLLDPVMVLRRLETSDKDLPREDMQRLADNFWILLRQELSKDYVLVDLPGPDVLRVQAALTDVKKSKAPADTITSIAPPALIISKGKEFATGKPLFVGEVSLEGKVTDAQTGELLAAGVDRKVGGKSIQGATDSWDDVNQSLELWSKTFRFRLCQWRGEIGCVDPTQ